MMAVGHLPHLVVVVVVVVVVVWYCYYQIDHTNCKLMVVLVVVGGVGWKIVCAGGVTPHQTLALESNSQWRGGF